MTENIEGLPPQNTVTVAAPNAGVPSQAEIDELRHRAEVSSQNFERLKKEQEERERLQAELETLKANTGSSEPGDERVGKLETELSDLKTKLYKAEVLESYPILKGMWSELEEFRNHPDNKGMNLRTSAKAFLVEKELLEPQRKGLERQTSGPRTPLTTGMTSEEVSQLRTTDFKKYSDMLRKGQIKFSS